MIGQSRCLGSFSVFTLRVAKSSGPTSHSVFWLLNGFQSISCQPGTRRSVNGERIGSPSTLQIGDFTYLTERIESRFVPSSLLCGMTFGTLIRVRIADSELLGSRKRVSQGLTTVGMNLRDPS